MKRIMILLIILMSLASNTMATWISNSPVNTESVSIGFTKIKNNFIFLQSIGQQLFAYNSGTSYIMGWDNADPNNIYSVGKIISLTNSSAFPRTTPFTGDLYFNTTSKVLNIYHSNQWWAIGSQLLRSSSDPATCSADTEGMIYYNTTNHTTYECHYKNSTYEWAAIAESRTETSGVTTICNEAETCYDGTIYLGGDSKIDITGQVINGKKFFTYGYNESTHSFTKSLDIETVVPGKTHAPVSEKRGNSPIGTEILWFSADGARDDTIYFYWTSPPGGFDESTPISIGIKFVIDSTAAGTVVLLTKVVGDVNTTDYITTNVSVTGMSGLPEGDSINVFDYDQTIWYTIGSVWTSTGQTGKISITRDSDNGNDSYPGRFGIVNITIKWGEKYQW